MTAAPYMSSPGPRPGRVGAILRPCLGRLYEPRPVCPAAGSVGRCTGGRSSGLPAGGPHDRKTLRMTRTGQFIKLRDAYCLRSRRKTGHESRVRGDLLPEVRFLYRTAWRRIDDSGPPGVRLPAQEYNLQTLQTCILGRGNCDLREEHLLLLRYLPIALSLQNFSALPLALLWHPWPHPVLH